MQWDAGTYAGFSQREPWIGIPENHSYINVAAEEEDGDSILNYYRKLIDLRKKYAVIQDGDIEFFCREQTELFAYRRRLGDQELLVVNNLTGEETVLKEEVSLEGYRCLLSNYSLKEEPALLKTLKPYESVIYLRDH